MRRWASRQTAAPQLFSEFVSRQVLTELCMTGERITGERLHALGPVNRLAEPGEALALAQALVLASQVAAGPELSMARIKALCRSAYVQTLGEQLEEEAPFMVRSQETEESREGISAFLQKRPPDFAQLRNPPN
jgi:enoyl-CoA hydratase/carnithine racemase